MIKTQEKTKQKTVPYYSTEFKKDGTLTLPDNFFSMEWNANLVYQVISSIDANARSGIAQTKDRSMVHGGGRKPWRQKGTGNARHGSIRSPIWRGGGVTFGPSTEKKYTKKINKKMRVTALGVMLSRMLRENRIIFVKESPIQNPSTKTAIRFVEKGLDEISAPVDKSRKTLIVFPAMSEEVKKSFSNIQGWDALEVNRLNAQVLSRYRFIMFIDAEHIFTELEKRIV